MNLLPGIIGKIYIAPTTGGGMKAARYWRIDNIVRQSSGTQIYGFKFFTSGFSADSLEPVSIITDAGDQTSEFDRSSVKGDSAGSVKTIDAVTFFTFDFGTDVKPDRLEIWGYEWDVDYIVSADISWSNNNSTWTKVGEWNANTQVNRPNWDGQAYVMRIISSDTDMQISNANIAVIEGKRSDALLMSRAMMTVIHGRSPNKIVLNRPVITVIEKPV